MTVPALLAAQAAERPSAVAIRSKRHGLWRAVTYADLQQRVEAVAAGLRGVGAGPGSAVGLVAENSLEWIICDLAIQAAGGTSVALPAQTPAPAAARSLAAAGVTAVICGDQEHVDLVLDQAEALAAVKAVVVIDPLGTSDYEDPRLRSLAELEAGAVGGGESAVANGAPGTGEPALVLFSAGTTGDPRPVAHSSASMAESAKALAGWLGLTPKDRNVTVLPLATPGSRALDLYAALAAGAQIAIPESPATVPADLVDAMPTVLVASPRALELMRKTSERRARESSRSRRAAYGWATRRMQSRLDKGGDKARTAEGTRRGRGLPYWLVGRFIARDLGVQSTRRIVVTGGSAGARDARFYWALGIPVLETYGQAELGGPVLAQASLDDTGTAGRPLPGVEARIEDGMLAVNAPASGGWHLTGDLAEDAGDGRIRVRGRQQEMVTSAGRDVAVVEVEQALCDSIYIRRAVVAPVRGDALTAILEVDPDETGRWANARDLHFSTYTSLVTNPEVAELVGQEVGAANGRLGGRASVADYVVVSQPLSVGAGDLTASLTVRRHAVVERHAGEAAAPAAAPGPS